MRSNDTLLKELPEALTLCQYLYMDKDNSVKVPGMVPGTWFRYTMNEDLDIIEQFMPNLGERHPKEWMPPSIDREMTVSKLCNVVRNLKELPAEEFPDSFSNRWEEINRITLDTVGLNKYKQRRKD